MAVLHYYVDTASAGGDGTTTGLSGTTAAFASLAAALSALKQDMTTTGNNVVIHCAASAGGADTTALSFTGWLGNATNYLTIQVDTANRHSGVWDATKYRLQTSSAPVFGAPPAYTRFIGLQTLCSSDDINTAHFSPTSAGGVTNADKSMGCQVIAHIGRWTDKNYTYGQQYFVNTGTDQTTAAWVIRNCLYYGGNGTHGHTGSKAIFSTNTLTVVENCTLIGFGAANDATSVGIQDGYARVRAVNCLVYNWASFGNPHASGTDYNATDLATGSGATGATHERVSQAFTFVDAANGKYQLASSDTGAKGYGTDLSADASWPFSDDITGTTRTVPWDIGAFTAATAGGSSDAATGTLSEAGESLGGTATASDATTGTATEAGEAIAGSSSSTATASGTASEVGESASGTATASAATSGTIGEGGEALGGTATVSESASGSAAQAGESLTGNTGAAPGQASGTIAQAGESLSGTSSSSTSASGTAGETESLSGTASAAAAGSGSFTQAGESASGSAAASVGASGAFAEAGTSMSAAATVTAPGAPMAFRVRISLTPAVRRSARLAPMLRARTSLLPS